MAAIKTLVARLFEEESGQDLVEYALLAALLGVACIAGMKLLSGNATNLFTKTINALK
jgi:pilus assembly protein Flp/PilA